VRSDMHSILFHPFDGEGCRRQKGHFCPAAPHIALSIPAWPLNMLLLQPSRRERLMRNLRAGRIEVFHLLVLHQDF
jgi:hypothetical protein